MKLAFIGAHGVGKTTLCFDLASRLKRLDLGVDIVKEVARNCPLPINRDTTLEAQAWILHTQIAQEIAAVSRDQMVICDRSVLDNYAYLVHRAGRRAEFDPLVAAWVTTYDALFKVPVLHPPSFDGQRDVSAVFQAEIDEVIDGLIAAFGVPCHRLDPADREGWVDSALGAAGLPLKQPQIDLFKQSQLMTTFVQTTGSFKQGARTMPGEYYTSPEIFAEEQERLFGRSWICVGRTDRLATPGDFFVRSIAGDSLIFLRDKGGALRAFFNVCRHRGTRLCAQESGHLSETIQCQYHAWTYTTEGRLIGAPHMNEVAGFDKADYPLHQAAVMEWEGFLFVNLDRHPRGFEESHAPLIGRFARFNLPRLRVGHRVTYDVHTNWKLVFQNYNECLHCPVIHPELSARMPYQSGANDLTEGPFLGGYMVISEPAVSVTMTGAACGLPIADLPAEDRRRAYYYSFQPNMLLSIQPDYVNYYTLWPLSPTETRVESEWMFHPEAFGREDFNPQDAIEFWDVTNRQDWRITEESQAGIRSRRYEPGPYSPRESVPAAWDRAYLEAMGR